jgi:hypothetical protein
MIVQVVLWRQIADELTEHQFGIAVEFLQAIARLSVNETALPADQVNAARQCGADYFRL